MPPPLLYSTILNLVAAFCLIVYYNSGNETKEVCQDKLLKAFLLMVPLSSRHLLISINYWFHYVFIYQTEDALDLSPKSCSPSSPVFRLFSGSSQSLLLQISLLVPLLLFGDSCLGLLICMQFPSTVSFVHQFFFFPHLHPLQPYHAAAHTGFITTKQKVDLKKGTYIFMINNFYLLHHFLMVPSFSNAFVKNIYFYLKLQTQTF